MITVIIVPGFAFGFDEIIGMALPAAVQISSLKFNQGLSAASRLVLRV